MVSARSLSASCRPSGPMPYLTPVRKPCRRCGRHDPHLQVATWNERLLRRVTVPKTLTNGDCGTCSTLDATMVPFDWRKPLTFTNWPGLSLLSDGAGSPARPPKAVLGSMRTV